MPYPAPPATAPLTTYTVIHNGERDEPELMQAGDDGRLYWVNEQGRRSAGSARLDRWPILGEIAAGDARAATREMRRQWPPAAPRTPRLTWGWLAPDGRFYPCANGAHDELATRLEAAFYPSSIGAGALEHGGWLRVEADGTHQGAARGITQAQFDTLTEMAATAHEEPQATLRAFLTTIALRDTGLA